MHSSSKTIAVTLCCSEEDLPRVRPLAETLEREALEVHLCVGVDLDARTLERHMAKPRPPGVFILCESLDLDAYQLPELEARFETHRGEDDQLVHVNIEKLEAEEILERIRATVAQLAGETRDEQTLKPSSKQSAGGEDLAEAIALAKKLAEAEAAQRRAEADAAPEPEPEPQPEAKPEPQSQPDDEGQGRPVARIAALLALLVAAGLAWYAWNSGMFGQGAATPDEPSATAPGEAAPADASAPRTPPGGVAGEAAGGAAGEAAGEAEPSSEDEAPPPDDPPGAEVEAPVEADDAPAVVVAPKLGEIRELDGLLVAPVNDMVFTWRDASNHCRLNRRGGKGGWRLTSINQLKQLRKAGMLGPGVYWSTTLARLGGTKNLVLDTAETGTRAESKTKFQARAQCVRAR